MGRVGIWDLGSHPGLGSSYFMILPHSVGMGSIGFEQMTSSIPLSKERCSRSGEDLPVRQQVKEFA